MVHITLGTGVGSGIIIEGNLFHGSSGFGAEFGHTVVNPDGLPCNCGGRGCVETEASASKIVRNYLKLTGKNEDMTSEDVYKLAKKGDTNAVEAFRIAGYYLGIGLSNLINLLNPEIIVLGGGVISAGDFIMKPVMEEIEKRAIRFSLENVKIVPALLGNKAGMLGSALWAMENLSGKI
jgi:glucokinase